MNLEVLKLTPRRKKILDSLDIKSVEELLEYYPYRYEENISKPFNEWMIGETITFEGLIISSPSTFRYGRKSVTRFKVISDEEELLVTIFNRPWLKVSNDTIVVKGKYEGGNKVTALNYSFNELNDELGIKAIYSLSEGVKQSDIVAMMKKALEIYSFDDIVPSDLIRKHHLIDRQKAIREIHFPSDKSSLKKAISRLKYDEFLRFYTLLKEIKNNNLTNKKPKVFNREKIYELINSLPFELTTDQKKCIDEILNDLSLPSTITRLVQGDVGSGKTIVAIIALYATVLSGQQGALMAPTEILAKQHYVSIKEILGDLNISLLYSDMKDSDKVKKAIKNGEIDIIVGTHALFSDDVEYHDLGLVIADEQHRFGVKQRRKLKDKGKDVDLLLMSATPIPRTLASSIYGDMDVSTIESMPTGRKGCDTYLIEQNSIVSIMDDIKNTLSKGRQVYIIASAIDKSDYLNVKDATSLYNSLIEVMKPYRLGLLHGKLDQKSKDEMMDCFLNQKIDVLISTTVVEVGVNVKNATMMIIYDADRFGLSQLHQLRGRIQRGDHKGTCYLLTASKDKEALNRLKVLTSSNDGFYIANEDLKLRGPGDILGTRQSGLPPFILGDIVNDIDFIHAAKEDAEAMLIDKENVEYKNYCAKISALATLNNLD